MNFNKLNIFFISICTCLILTLFACETEAIDNNVKSTQVDDKEELKSSIEKANRYMLLQEAELINDYIKRHNLDVQETGTGLRYQILKNGSGEYIKRGEVVELEYETRLLTGDLLYSSKNMGNKTFVVGKGGVESGLEEAVLKLRKGDVAVVILPSHLAHGMLGDGNRIPPKAAIVYKIKVVDNQYKN